MDHSVRAYLERMSMDRLLHLVDTYVSAESNVLTDDELLNILDILIARNSSEGGRLSSYIDKIRLHQK